MCVGESLYWFRQSLVLFAVCFLSLSCGVMLAYPSVLNPALMDPKSDIRATPSEASWLASITGIAGAVAFLILAPIMQIYGRRMIHITMNVAMAISWIIFFYGQSLTALFIARALQGIGMGSIFINMVLIAEYSSPTRRGYFATIQKTFISSGTMVCHIMALWFTWRQIAVPALVVSILGVVMTFFWTESPFFLAMVGKYDECERSFHWLNGTTSRNSELEDLIRDQKKCREEKKKQTGGNLKKFVKQFIRPDFQKSFLITVLMIITMDISGRNYFKAYVIQIMMEFTGSRSTAVYISIGSDLLVLIALMISCFIVRYFNRRHLVFSFGSVTAISLLGLGLILFLKSLDVITLWAWLPPSLILFINFVIHIGVSPVCFIILGEIFPLELKGLACFLSGLVFTISYGSVMKLTPVFIESIGLGGTYLVYGAGLALCLATLFFKLPETKDRPLLDIEHSLKGLEKTDKTEMLLKP